MTKYLILIVFGLLMGCASYRPLTVGMTTNDIIKERGQPEYRKKVLNYEIWLYETRKDGWFFSPHADFENDVLLTRDDKVVVSRKFTYSIPTFFGPVYDKDLFDGWASHASEEVLRKDLDCIIAGKIRKGMSSVPVLLCFGQPEKIGPGRGSLGSSFDYLDKQIIFWMGAVSSVSNDSILMH